MCGGVVDRLLHGGDFFSLFVRDFHFEFVFQGHHQFHGVQGIGAQVVDEGGFDFDVCFCNAQLIIDDFLNALFDIRQVMAPKCVLRKVRAFYQVCASEY